MRSCSSFAALEKASSMPSGHIAGTFLKLLQYNDLRISSTD